jgi:rhodanese-related sulfurtransferase
MQCLAIWSGIFCNLDHDPSLFEDRIFAKTNGVMKRLFSAFLLSVFIGFTSCSVTGQQDNHDLAPVLVDVQQAHALMEKGDVTVIDVRTPNEVSQGYISGALQWDFFNWESVEQNASELDKSKPVMVYCKVGGRSAKTATYLSDQGFEKVYDVKGGIDAWKAANLPIKVD